MNNTKTLVLRAFRGLFGPIAGILLRAGVTWREVLEIAKLTYVEVATRDFGINGRPTNVSRVSILTGLPRREISRIRKLFGQPESNLVADGMNHATRVLTGWHTDDEFSDGSGIPLPLVKDGNDSSFESLCKRYVGDVAPSTVLKELIHVGAVASDEQGMLLAKKRFYMPHQLEAAQILSSGSVLEDLGKTVAYNLYRSTDDLPKFERRATNTQVRAESVPEFQRFLEQEGQVFLERVDVWLSEHEAADGSNEPTVRLGLGAYWIEE